MRLIIIKPCLSGIWLLGKSFFLFKTFVEGGFVREFFLFISSSIIMVSPVDIFNSLSVVASEKCKGTGGKALEGKKIYVVKAFFF
jgi:hypothetical protein